MLALVNFQVGATDISTTPLATASPTQVKPNIFYVLDDSGSMGYNYLPDWAVTDYTATNYSNNASSNLFNNNGYNGVAYNAATTYTPPVYYDGSNYKSMNSTNTSTWSKVPGDGFGIQSTSTSNLVGASSFYTFIPGEYCSSNRLIRSTCNVQSAPTSTYPYPAYLSWCTDATLTVCQASRIETAPSGGKTYTYARYPGGQGQGSTSTSTLTLSGTSSTSVSSVKVGSNQILSATTASSTSASTLAGYIAANINACTSSKTGSCAVSGYSATASNGTVTITAPGSSTSTPTITASGSISITPTAFTTTFSVPGSNVLTTIASTTTSYPYPGSTAKASTRTDCVGTTCSYAEEMTNYANWYAYYRTRMQMTKTGATLAFSALTSSYRIGYMSINNNTTKDFLDIADATSGSTGQMAAWYAKFVAANPNNSTPTRMALSTAGQYYAGKLTKVNGQTASDPMQYSCQRNYMFISTDGYWNEGNTASTTTNTTVSTGSYSTNTSLVGLLDLAGKNLGDQDGGTTSLPYSEGSTATYNTMADIAYYYYITDIRSTTFSNSTNRQTGVDLSANSVADQKQHIYTSTMGLGASGYMMYQADYATAKSGDYFDVSRGTTASAASALAGICSWQTSGPCTWPVPVSNGQTTIDDLWHTAVNGHGSYYSAQNPIDVRNSLVSFLASVIATWGSSAAATASTPNVTTTNNFVYKSSYISQNWFGEIAQYTIDVVTGIVSTYPSWSESGTVPASATSTTTPVLDNLDYTTRAIYTHDVNKSVTGLTSFSWASLSSTVQAYFQTPAISSLSQLCASGSTCLPTASQVNATTAGSTTGAGGINLLNYLIGDRSNELPAGGAYYRQRLHVLGDVVDSQPSYVAAPLFSYSDAGYAAFKTTNSARQGMLYIGANDGMLHAFNGSTGTEVWAYVPSMVLPSLYQLADMNYSANHAFYVDGTPQTGDVNLSSTTTPDWHTILVGGLGAGGSGYYALDITNPSSPTLLWEFKYGATQTSAVNGFTTDPDLGLSFGTPVITKLSDGTWVVLVTSGYNNTSGSGHGIMWVLNAKTGAIIKKIDTGVGTSANPSGLAQISAYVANAPTNNMALSIYGGDLLGNLWRINMGSLTATGGTATAQLLTTLKDSSNVARPITIAPVLGNNNGTRLVYVGTGQMLGFSDLSSTQSQAIYAIKDLLASTTSPGTIPVYTNPGGNLCTSTSLTNCFVSVALADSTSGVRTATSTISMNLSTMNGWFATLPESGERINTSFDLQQGALVFASNIPGASSACSVGGQSYLNYLNFSTGLAISGSTTVGALLASGSVTSLANAASLVRLPSGKVIAIVNLSNGSTITQTVPISSSSLGVRRVSWRELTN